MMRGPLERGTVPFLDASSTKALTVLALIFGTPLPRAGMPTGRR